MFRTLALVALAGSLMAAEPVWPGGKAYAVSLTYDDAIDSQLLNGAFALDQRGLKATFFLTGASQSISDNPKAWAALAAKGHELANHTMHHPCPGNPNAPFPPKELWLQGFDAKRYAQEMDQCQAVIRGLGAPTALSFAWPCGAAWVGEDKQDISPLAAQRFKAVRDAWGGFADPYKVDLMHVPAVDGARSLPNLLADLAAAKRKGAWVVLLFHGVGGDYLSVDNDVHAALLDALAADKDAWVAPFGNVAARVAQIQKKR
jgi:peptidoglycan/xylan/chitin deacetylase (PgdA/CDA1 family)